jgi:hypothetical protein
MRAQTPARTAPLRYSLVAAATVDTPSKPVLAAPRRSWLPSLFGRSLQHSEEQPHECLGSLISLADHEEIPPPVRVTAFDYRVVPLSLRAATSREPGRISERSQQFLGRGRGAREQCSLEVPSLIARSTILP